MNFGICFKNIELLYRNKSLINFYLENTIIFQSQAPFFYVIGMNIAKNPLVLFFSSFWLPI